MGSLPLRDDNISTHLWVPSWLATGSRNPPMWDCPLVRVSTLLLGLPLSEPLCLLVPLMRLPPLEEDNTNTSLWAPVVWPTGRWIACSFPLPMSLYCLYCPPPRVQSSWLYWWDYPYLESTVDPLYNWDCPHSESCQVCHSANEITPTRRWLWTYLATGIIPLSESKVYHSANEITPTRRWLWTNSANEFVPFSESCQVWSSADGTTDPLC